MNEIIPEGRKSLEKRRTLGRPTLLNIDKAYKVVHAIRITGSIEGAAALCGIARRTYYNWLRYGERMALREAECYRLDPEDEPFAILYRNVMNELSLLEQRYFEVVKNAAGDGAWQAAAWILERRFPERWGRRGSHNEPPVHITTDQVTIKQETKGEAKS